MSAHHVTIHAAGLNPTEITVNDHHHTTGSDLVSIHLDDDVHMQGTLAEMQAVVGRLADLVAEAAAARLVIQYPTRPDEPVEHSQVRIIGAGAMQAAAARDRDSLTNTQAELVALLDEQQEGQR